MEGDHRVPGRIGGPVLLLLLALGATRAEEVVPGTRLALGEGIAAHRLLGPATAAQRGVKPGPGLVGRAGTELWVTTGARVYEVHGGTFKGLATGGPLTGLAVLGGELLAVRGRELMGLEGVAFRTRAVLPESDMRIEALEGDEGLLLYGGRETGTSIYVLLGDGRYERLVEADGPVTAALEAQGEVVFACGRDLWLLARLGRPVKVYTAFRPIFSIARRPGSGDLWFATPSGVFALRAGGVQPVLAGATGFLRHDGRFLVVSDPVRRTVLALSGDPIGSGEPDPMPGAATGGPLESSRQGAEAESRPVPRPSPGGLDFMK